MSRFRNVFFITFLVGCFSLPLYASPLIVRVADYYPAFYKTDAGWQGMDIDVLKAVFAEAGLAYEFVEYPFKRALLLMEAGEVHILANLVKNSERSEFMHWIGPTRYTAIALIVTKQNTGLPIKTYQDLITVAASEKKKFGYILGASYSEVFDQLLANDSAFQAILDYVPKAELNINKLQAGRILGFFEDDYEAGRRIADNRPEYAAFQDFALHAYRIEESEGGAYIGITKKLDPEIVGRLRSAYTTIIQNGAFTDIHTQWMGYPPPEHRKFDE